MHAVPDEKPAQPTQQDVEPLYTQQSVRVLQVWTPAQVRSAISSADGGHMSLAAELCDNLLADESIGGAIETRTGGLQGLPLTFQDGRGDEAGDSPLAPELTEDCTHSYPEEETKQLAAWGLMLGVGFAEQVWTEEDGRFRPRSSPWIIPSPDRVSRPVRSPADSPGAVGKGRGCRATPLSSRRRCAAPCRSHGRGGRRRPRCPA